MQAKIIEATCIPLSRVRTMDGKKPIEQKNDFRQKNAIFAKQLPPQNSNAERHYLMHQASEHAPPPVKS